VDEARQAGDDGRSDALNGLDDAAPAAAETSNQPLPPSLRQRLDQSADDWVAECALRRVVAQRSARRHALPWMIAGAALLLSVVSWWPRLAEFTPGVGVTGLVHDWRVERACERMLASPGVERWAWGGASESGNGEFVWDPRRQRGYLRLSGFVSNDPSRAQYQFWIFDAARDERYPVDGGVFDVPPGRSQVIVPVHASRHVSRVAAFSVTVEQPGGAVVSARDKVVAFARGGT
jgi:hypothetical protein